ncbi:MAG: hypothetical protein KBA75_01185 [Alphaproteobacteria bacterium]|nr:hypothetical protein [Alphaproteobacteria bacterium]
MASGQNFFSAALPIGALLLGFSAHAEGMPPLTIVEGDDLPQDIVPTKMAVLSKKPQSSHKKHPVGRVKTEHLVALRRDGLAQVWQAVAAMPVVNAPVRQCAHQSVHWQRSCGEMGYPESFSGSVQGVTDVDCSAQIRHERWLVNSCAPEIARVPAETFIAAVPSPQIVTVPTPVLSSAAEPAAATAAVTPIPVITSAAVPVLADDATPVVAIPKIRSSVTVAGACGPAAANLHSSKPESGLCATGTVENVVGNGPWQWSCSGSVGGVSTTCFAPVDFAALVARQTQEAVEVKPVVTSAPSLPPVQEAKAAVSIDLQEVPPETQPAPQLALVTPQLVTPSLTTTTTVTTQSAPLATAALATPRLDLALRSNRPEPGSIDYAPAAPIRAAATLNPSNVGSAVIVPSELSTLAFGVGKDAPEEAIMAQLESFGQKLAVNRLARVTVTAYASMGDGVDARAARKLSLARAMVVRDALMMGGATSDQIRTRALGANVAVGTPERVDLTDN